MSRRPDGSCFNPGLEKAWAAAKEIGAVVSFPDFKQDDPDKATDWCDFLLRHGKEETAKAFLSRITDPTVTALPNPPCPKRSSQERKSDDPGNWPEEQPLEAHSEEFGSPPAHVTELRDDAPPEEGHVASDRPRAVGQPGPLTHRVSDWKSRLIPGGEVGEGHPFPFDGKSKVNAYLFLKHHERFAGLLCYNEFADSVMLSRRPPWDDGTSDPAPRRIRDDDFFMLAAHLEYCDISASKETTADAAVRVAKENAINPPREFLSRLVWDRRPRLDTWLTYYLGADEQPAEYLALVGAKWLIGAASRVFEPGVKFDNLLILEGSQGLGKSMALRGLATFHGEDFFLDSVGDLHSKDTLMTMQGKLIVEIAELASFRKSENQEIKAFITRQVDEYRPPYGRTVVRRPRCFVLAGSTNEIEEGYLTDDTGNRRYWPVKCGSIDAEAIARDAPQLWAEATVRYRAGERTWLTMEEARLSTHEQKQRFVEDAWQDRIAEIVRNEWALKVDDVLNRLQLQPRDITNMTKKRVKNSLRQLGWHETRRAGEGRLWRPIGVEQAVASLDE